LKSFSPASLMNSMIAMGFASFRDCDDLREAARGKRIPEGVQESHPDLR
jgi:hypothetical protein